jgi:hypothetical protein
MEIFILLTCTVVICIEQGKQCANDKNVGVLFECHFDGDLSR